MTKRLLPDQERTLRLIEGIITMARAISEGDVALLGIRLGTLIKFGPRFDPASWSDGGRELRRLLRLQEAFLRFRKELEEIYREE